MKKIEETAMQGNFTHNLNHKVMLRGKGYFGPEKGRAVSEIFKLTNSEKKRLSKISTTFQNCKKVLWKSATKVILGVIFNFVLYGDENFKIFETFLHTKRPFLAGFGKWAVSY